MGLRKRDKITLPENIKKLKSGLKKRDKVALPEDIKKECMGIIHGASVACGGIGTGLAQIPLSDNAAITPIQIGMIVALGKVFDIAVTQTAAKAIISGAGASLIGRGASQVLCGWIPGVGNVINTATAAALTEAIGWMAVEQFARESANTNINIPANSDSVTQKNEYSHKDSSTFNSENKANNRIQYDEMKRRIIDFINSGNTSSTHPLEYERLCSDVENIVSQDKSDEQLIRLYNKLMRNG